ncbi:MAG TPA: hypothetical protein VMD08_11940 [Candidatus Baltobacteraceae bacterium]|nr:hypothetical protein [Candidatus Baltobacteraceae bacterium]
MTPESKHELESALRELESERQNLERQIGTIRSLLHSGGRTLHIVKSHGDKRRVVSALTRKRQSEAAKVRWARYRSGLKAA